MSIQDVKQWTCDACGEAAIGMAPKGWFGGTVRVLDMYGAVDKVDWAACSTAHIGAAVQTMQENHLQNDF